MNRPYRCGLRLRVSVMLLGSLATSMLSRANSITPLGIFDGTTSYATSINNAGDVIGYAVNNGNDEGFYYNGSTTTLLPVFPGGNTIVQPNGLSQNSGLVVGTAYAAGNAPQAFLYTFGALNLVDIQTLGGLDSFGFGVNDSDIAVGRSYTAGSPQDAFLYNGSIAPLGGTGTYGNYTYVEADHINDNNQVAGNASAGQAFYYGGTSYVALTLGGPSSTANAMNDGGYVAGESMLSTGSN